MQTGGIAVVEQGGGTLDQVVGLRSHNDAVALHDRCLEALHGRSLASRHGRLAMQSVGVRTHWDRHGGVCFFLALRRGHTAFRSRSPAVISFISSCGNSNQRQRRGMIA